MAEYKEVEIDFSDLESIREAMDKYHTTETALVGKNSNGELITTSIHKDLIVLETFQKNHWVRKNYFHRDGTVEEMFDGKWE